MQTIKMSLRQLPTAGRTKSKGRFFAILSRENFLVRWVLHFWRFLLQKQGRYFKAVPWKSPFFFSNSEIYLMHQTLPKLSLVVWNPQRHRFNSNLSSSSIVSTFLLIVFGCVERWFVWDVWTVEIVSKGHTWTWKLKIEGKPEITNGNRMPGGK